MIADISLSVNANDLKCKKIFQFAASPATFPGGENAYASFHACKLEESTMEKQLLWGLGAAVGAALLGLGCAAFWPTSEEPPAERPVTGFVIHQAAEPASLDQQLSVTVTIGGAAQTLTLGDYLCGVVLGEMPESYPEEALKAQAVAARTYTLRRISQNKELSDDPATCQAYRDPDTAEDPARIRQIVEETDGLVLTYGGALIEATYFSGASGRTESAQAVWGGAVPYLVSVESPETAATSQVTVDKSEFLEILGIETAEIGSITYTSGGGVDTITIGGEVFTGLELRQKFSLDSTQFTLTADDSTVTFQVEGSGHRVGLSQQGAKTLAENGSSFQEILTWYYTDVTLETWNGYGSQLPQGE
jgi:stage II sporulation protein D